MNQKSRNTLVYALVIFLFVFTLPVTVEMFAIALPMLVLVRVVSRLIAKIYKQFNES